MIILSQKAKHRLILAVKIWLGLVISSLVFIGGVLFEVASQPEGKATMDITCKELAFEIEKGYPFSLNIDRDYRLSFYKNKDGKWKIIEEKR